MKLRASAASILVLFAAACASSQPPQPTSETLRFSLGQVALGTPLSSARQLLGAPSSEESGIDDECGSGAWTKLTYPGLVIRSAFPDKTVVKNPPRVPYVSSIDTTDSRWRFANGLGVGSRREEIIQTLGEPEHREDYGSEERIYYALADFDASIGFVLVDGVATEAGITESWC
jgi:hypothetical protein